MFQRAVVMPAISIANKFGDVGPLVAIGTVFVRVCVQMATILVRRSMVLTGRMAARATGALTRMLAGTIAESNFTLVRNSSHQL
jgi:hypothetical protein